MSHNKEMDDGALFVMDGIAATHDGMEHSSRKRFRKKNNDDINIAELAKQVCAGSRLHLSKAITLLESTNNYHKEKGQELLQELLPYTGKSMRVGITGVPGAGKSTFIEAFGGKLCDMGHRVAVLAIDPSSSLTGGSILGDKTRMEELTRNPRAFIRPSPSSGTLGGVHKKSRETMLLCEAAGYDIILIETVGVGQSETIVRGMVDFFLLLVLTGAGDELQGMKKGIMELADTIVVHKADGDNMRQAKKTVAEYKQFLHFLQPATPGWTTQSMPVSSYENKGLEKVWETILQFKEICVENDHWLTRRSEQTTEWFRSMITDHLIDSFYGQPERKQQVKDLESQILNGQLTVTQGVGQLFHKP
ncbi:methylmalonyl Co-A mutase-associated GTPase MeaB [Viridibacillus sp. YIM B01967]|uniref:Methylmalonyl Co-A mutase-associated GTPase MeaB n=1 Tax=Viridibacillus soli TaxID=2798301 RepID=A0ABS1H457_9BACL|nr:methylmalonyl Co-A mutase-associated GTPase MeaB [Viridibacillus soli]MBK3494076.1 methylmalonyl Co-A mutase-associated GTPase MeaB [Viridibacillus soli]